MEHRLLGQPVGRALHGLPPFVPHHVPLVFQLFIIQGLQQKAHAVAFQPERQLQLIRGERFEIIGSIEIRGAVYIACSRCLEDLKVAVFRDVFRALKHHVFEQVRETSSSGTFVRRPYVIPEVDRHERQTVLFKQDHLKPVLEPVLFKVEIRDILGCRHTLSCSLAS